MSNLVLSFFNFIKIAMKKVFFLFIILTFLGCDNNSFNNSNPFIPNYSFSITINTDLPEYNKLQFPSNAAYNGNGGAKGIIIFNTGTGYNAFDAACPNQALNSCNAMTINGIEAVCSCDNAKYNLFTGQSPEKQYPMKQYRVEVNGSMIHVYN